MCTEPKEDSSPRPPPLQRAVECEEDEERQNRFGGPARGDRKDEWVEEMDGGEEGCLTFDVYLAVDVIAGFGPIGTGARCDGGESDGYKEPVHQDTREDVASCKEIFAEGGMEPMVRCEEDSEERSVAVRLSRVWAVDCTLVSRFSRGSMKDSLTRQQRATCPEDLVHGCQVLAGERSGQRP